MYFESRFVLPYSAIVLLFAFVFSNVTMAQETIGLWTVNAPDSASQISGAFDPNSWLNVVNAPVTVDEAFSGESILDEGFANSAPGLTFEVVFNNGVINSSCLLYTSPSPRDGLLSRMPSSA